MVTTDGDDVSTAGLPNKWAFKDEWYNLIPYPSFVRVLLETDQATSTKDRSGGHPGHAVLGEKHPLSWCQYYDGGRAWLTTLGHDVAAWSEAELKGDEYFKEHVVQGLQSAMGVQAFCK